MANSSHIIPKASGKRTSEPVTNARTSLRNSSDSKVWTVQDSETLYQGKLAESNMTPALLEQEIRNEYSRVHYSTALVAGLRMPLVYGAL